MFLIAATPGYFSSLSLVHDLVCRGRIRGKRRFPTESFLLHEEQCFSSSSFARTLHLFQGRDTEPAVCCREDSFARTLRLFQAEKRSPPFVAERKSFHCSGLVHCSGFLSSFPCRSLLRGRPRSLFALVPNPRNGAAGLCVRRMMSD